MNEVVTKEEVLKWLNKLEPLVDTIEFTDRGKGQFENMKAYISDSKYFLEKGDLVRSFEACIWAWAIYEISKEYGQFKDK